MRIISSHYLKCVASLWAVVLLLASGVSAETGPSSAGGSSVFKNSKSKTDSEALKTLVELEFKAISYMETSQVDANSQQQFQMNLTLKKQGTFFTETNLIIGSFSEPNSVYYAFPQAYMGYGKEEANVVAGRKKENLSVADSVFNLGLVQSSFTNDNINFAESGLTGISTTYNSGNMGFIAGYMPIFIPNQGPQVKVEDGKAVSSNRWAATPPSTFVTGTESKNINYAIRDYKLIDIISNSGFLLNAHYGQNKLRPVANLSFSRKPINDIAFSRDTYQDIATAEGFVYLTPVVLAHDIQALDINLDYENINTTLSYIADQPQNVKAKNSEVIQTLNPLNIISFYASLDLAEVLRRKMKVYMAMAIISGGEIRDLTAEGKESAVSVSGSRTLFKKPLKLGVSGEAFYIYNNSVETDMSFTYDQELKGSLLSLAVKYSALKNMKISMGADIIGTENELATGQQDHFLNQHKADDRFFAGLSYVF